ncbi:MAG: ribosome silencing factor [Kiritimatiellae bacterium]|nr:ribosome silencing factor [Kiritimatiellia bacterium]
MEPNTLELLGAAREALWAKKAQDVVVLDVRELSAVTDYYIIASGLSALHLKALQQAVHAGMKPYGLHPFRKAGAPESGWLAIDYIDFVVHLFSRDVRAYYALERLWSNAPRV